MLRWSFLFLSVWPLLLPPGFCLCRLGTFGDFAPGGARAAAEDVPRQSPSPCPCCRQKARQPGCRDCEFRFRAERPSGQSPEAPHSPSCPAHPSWQVSRAATAGTIVSLDEGGPDAVVVALAPACPALHALLRATAPLPDERPSLHVPLYLSCRDLLC